MRCSTLNGLRTTANALRAALTTDPVVTKREEAIQTALERVLAQGEAYQAARQAQREAEAAAAPQPMESTAVAQTEGCATCYCVKPGSTHAHRPASLAKKIRKGRRTKQVRPGVSGMNQFHPKPKKGRRRVKNKHHPGYTLTVAP